MNKVLKVILNIMIVIASLAFFVCFVLMIESFKYKNREVEDPAETYAGVFEYMLRHRAYGEIIGDYYSRRMDSFGPVAGYEDLYKVGAYAHAAFMARVYSEKDDQYGIDRCNSSMKDIRSELGDLAHNANEIDEMIKNAP